MEQSPGTVTGTWRGEYSGSAAAVEPGPRGVRVNAVAPGGAADPAGRGPRGRREVPYPTIGDAE